MENPRMVSPGIRFKILERDNFSCVYCGKMGNESQLHVDHVIAYSNGGTTTIDNLVTACSDCNLGKHAKNILSAERILEIIKERNLARGYQTNDDLVPKSKGKRTPKPKLYTVKPFRLSSHYNHSISCDLEKFRDKEVAALLLVQKLSLNEKSIIFHTIDSAIDSGKYSIINNDKDRILWVASFERHKFESMSGITIKSAIEKYDTYCPSKHFGPYPSWGVNVYTCTNTKGGGFHAAYIRLQLVCTYDKKTDFVKCEVHGGYIMLILEEFWNELIK